MKHIGRCLCGEVQFLIKKEIQVIYHCHCSLCRKQSGTGANAATLINEKHFEWSCNTEIIKTFKKNTGFTCCFCKYCGSPVPNKVGNTEFVWIPLGLLDEIPTVTQRLGFCLHSKSSWAPIISFDQEYIDLPTQQELEHYFRSL
ncbi:GFA family protein [Acinetobacter rathckeae]|uniref:GFA family protein n=1 Tax=Acinetobacter rathckeae TaxID=2605272 RepID=UPI0018A257FF|nr:GFA family protein [Acinetobacter rathckeae]MBF7695312.1 GFA family protein [Acinetobacter rathckeae]